MTQRLACAYSHRVQPGALRGPRRAQPAAHGMRRCLCRAALTPSDGSGAEPHQAGSGGDGSCASSERSGGRASSHSAAEWHVGGYEVRVSVVPLSSGKQRQTDMYSSGHGSGSSSASSKRSGSRASSCSVEEWHVRHPMLHCWLDGHAPIHPDNVLSAP